MPAPSRRSTTVMSPALRNSSARLASFAIFAYRGRYAASTRRASSSDLPLLSQPGQSNAEATATGFFLPRSTITRIALAMCATLPLRHSEGPVSFVTRLSLHLGAVVVLGVVLVFGAGLYAAGQLRAQALPKLKGLAGVSSLVITGAPTDEVDVTLDPSKLAAHRVSLAQVASALQQATVVQSVGALRQGTGTIPLQVTGYLTSLDQISNIVVVPASVARG